MNNEPVAWMNYVEHSDFYDLNISGRGIPLYTHPVKEQVETIEYTCPNCQTHVGLHVKHPVKELTDEEIWDLFQQTQHNAMDFAKAILRKAQE